MSGFSGVPTNPVVVRDGGSSVSNPFSSLLFNDSVGNTETITVTLSYDPNGLGNYGVNLTNLGTLSDPMNSGGFSGNVFTATALVTGQPTPASQILDRLVYAPPSISAGTDPTVTATVSVSSFNPNIGLGTASYGTETLQLVTPPLITGAVSDQPVQAGNSIQPFQNIQVIDGNYGYSPSVNETIAITDGGIATDADGLLTGSGLSKTGVGTYALSGNSYYLNSLNFGTTAGPGTRTAVFTLTANDSSTGFAATDVSTSVDVIGPTTTGGEHDLSPGEKYSAPSGESVLGSSGSNTVSASAGNVYMIAGSGDLAFIGGSAASTVTGGAGSSTIFGGSGGGYINGGRAGFNVMISQGASGANTTLTGAGGGNEIFGSASGNDDLVAGSGPIADSIIGGGGNTTIHGGSAADVIFTGGASTLAYGGSAGGDTIVGGAGGLKVNAQGGDAIFGGSGTLNVTGSTKGNDDIVGGTGALTYNGRGSNVLVVGGSGTSSITTGNGASLIFSGSGSASITGGTGGMTVELGSGKAAIAEGGGAAIFQLSKGAAGGIDVVSGFRAGTDQIQLFGYSTADLQIKTAGGSTQLTLSDGTSIKLSGVTSLGHSIVFG